MTDDPHDRLAQLTPAKLRKDEVLHIALAIHFEQLIEDSEKAALHRRSAALCRAVAGAERVLCEAMATIAITGGQNGPVVERQPDDGDSVFTVYPTLAAALGAAGEET